MKIGIFDDEFYSLQGRLLSEGYELLCYVGDQEIPEHVFNVTGISGTIVQAQTFTDFLHSDCDMFIIGTGEDKQHAYETLCLLHKDDGVAILGYDEAICELEYNRELAETLVRRYVPDNLLQVPHKYVFTDLDEACEWLITESNKPVDEQDGWVAKQHASSPQEIMHNRTVVSKPGQHLQLHALMRQERNAWFRPDGSGGIVFERFIEGQEICFGAWFNGETFSSTIYACEEHKGAQNGDRGRLLTGEVGSWLHWFHKAEGQAVEIFNHLVPVFKGRCNGMIDFNTILTSTGELYFVEFTIRFGRPTLELMLASFDTNVGGTFYNVKDDITVFDRLCKFERNVGTTVFSYGVPLLRQEDPGVGSIPFEMPESVNVGSNTFKVDSVQLFCRHNAELEQWVTANNERQFVMVASSNDLDYKTLSKLANQSLSDFDVLGLTWRDDVGLKADDILTKLTDFGILK